MLPPNVSVRSNMEVKENRVFLPDNLIPILESYENLLLISNPKLYQHSKRVSNLAEAIGRVLKLDPEDISGLRVAGLLHDISLVNLDNFYLEITEPHRLNHRTRIHPELSYQILHSLNDIDSDFEQVLLAIRHHHENFDGSGFPFGIKGERIPLGARILRIAECLSYLLSTNSNNGALRNIKHFLLSATPSKFDPCIVLKLLEENFLEKYLIKDSE